MTVTTEAAPGPRALNWGRALLGLAVSAVALGLLLALVDLEAVGAAFRRARVPLLLAAIPLVVASLATRARAWQHLLAAEVPLGATFSALNQGYLVNSLLPLRLGDLARSLLLARDRRLPTLRVLSSVLLERALDLAFVVALLLASSGLLGVLPGTTLPLALVPLQLTGVVVALVLAARHRERLQTRLQAAGGRWRTLRRLAVETLAGLAVLDRPGRVARAAGWLACTWLLAVALFWLCLAAFIPHPSLLHVTFGLAISALGIALPSSPSGLGVVEAAWTGALGLAGVDPAAAFAFALASHLLTTAVVVILGGWALARRGATLRALSREVREALPTSRRPRP